MNICDKINKLKGWKHHFMLMPWNCSSFFLFSSSSRKHLSFSVLVCCCYGGKNLLASINFDLIISDNEFSFSIDSSRSNKERTQRLFTVSSPFRNFIIIREFESFHRHHVNSRLWAFLPNILKLGYWKKQHCSCNSV